MALGGLTQWLTVTNVLIFATVGLLSIWVWRAYQRSRMLKKLGIPGPPALPFLLNNHTFLTEGFMGLLSKWTEQYPKIYGFYMLGDPTIMVSDLDLVRDVTVKNFNAFRNRIKDSLMQYKPWTENLLYLDDDHWKHVRSQLSPAFSAGKLKRMVPAIERVVKNLQNYIKSKAESGEEVELKQLCQCYAMDVIAGVAFGLQVDSLNDPNDPFIKHGKDFVNFDNGFVYIAMLFPSTVPVFNLLGITFPPKSANDFFQKVLGSALEERRHEQKKYGDFLQLLVEAEREGEDQGPVDAEIDHGHHLKTSSHWTRKGLTTDEIYGNTLIFLFAGNETVNTVMSFTLFSLAANPDCLAKAQAEIDAKLGKKPMDYDTALELTYLDMCLNETMRLYPPGFVIDREIAEDMEFGGYHIKKGWRIAIPTMAIHRDPSIWPDPLKFDPERFTPEARATRHPYAFMPFGLGPRNCIGMRLAQLEMRMAIATILQHFTPVLCDKSVYPPKLQKMMMAAVDGLWVKFKARA